MQIGIRLHDVNANGAEEQRTLEARAATARQEGFACVHLALTKCVPDAATDAAALTEGLAAYVRRVFRLHDLDVAVLGCYLNLAHPDAEKVRQFQSRYYGNLRVASAAGIAMVGTETGAPNASYQYDGNTHSYIAVERARGDSRRIMLLNFMVIGVKLSLTALFVYGMRGGLTMIAVASLISQLSLLAFGIRHSLRADEAFSFSREAVAMDRRTVMPMITQSVPVIAEKALFAFGKTVVNAMCVIYGDTMAGALGVSNNLGGITTNPQNGYQEGAAAIISQNYGAGKYRRVLEAFFATAVVNVILGAVISSLELWRLNQLAGLFDSGSESFRQMIMSVYRYEALGAVPLGINVAVLALLYGLGETRLTLALNFARVFVFRIPVFWFLQNHTGLGQASVGAVMLISNVSSGAAAAIVAAAVIARFMAVHKITANTT